MGNVKNRYSIIILVVLIISNVDIVSAQAPTPSCIGDPCVTPTVSFSPPTATIVPVVQPTPTPGGAATPVPMPTPIDFPMPIYSVPTSIPTISFPAISPPFNPSPIPIPNVLTMTKINLPITGTITLSTISATITLSYTTPLTNLTSISSSVGGGMLLTGNRLVNDMVFYTTWISGEIASLQSTNSFTVAAAPDWYAPYLPRPVANVGWTIENLRPYSSSGVTFSYKSLVYFAGYMMALPVKYSKSLYQYVIFLGPIGLFLTWLFLMLPIVIFVKMFVFVKNLFISLLNLIIKIVMAIIRFLVALWELIPGM